MNKLSWKRSLFVGAASSTIAFLFLYTDELSRHLGEYFQMYSVTWIIALVSLLFMCSKFIELSNAIKVSVFAVAIGYFSVLIAYVVAVMFDILSVREIHTEISFNEMIIPLVYPFIILKGWAFIMLLVSFTLLFNVVVSLLFSYSRD